jgi:hypothetical protein
VTQTDKQSAVAIDPAVFKYPGIVTSLGFADTGDCRNLVHGFL